MTRHKPDCGRTSHPHGGPGPWLGTTLQVCIALVAIIRLLIDLSR